MLPKPALARAPLRLGVVASARYRVGFDSSIGDPLVFRRTLDLTAPRASVRWNTMIGAHANPAFLTDQDDN